jgi:transcriptional regulator with AAA-type ATPase domain
VKTLATETSDTLRWGRADTEAEQELLHLVIAWSRDEPHRVGEAAPIEGPCILGRGWPGTQDPAPRVVFFRQRPAGAEPMPPLGGSRISRVQLELEPAPDGGLSVRSVGRCPMLVRGETVAQRILKPGDTLVLQNAMVLLVARRRPSLGGPGGLGDVPAFPFGEADPYGIVGESPAAWALRRALSFAARAQAHVLVQGESGSGKELAARAIHALSPRGTGPFVARNAATLPEGLVDAELFGSAKNYPNAGSPERAGIIGEANGGTLFLDEIGELAPQLQSHLLRVLDRGGEYQRLGESRVRRSDLRLIAATNRPLAALKHDFAARFTVRAEVPGLPARREDIPLLLQHLLRTAAAANPGLSEQFFERRHGQLAEPRIAPELIDAMLHHEYTDHLRELERWMWIALGTSRSSFLDLTAALHEQRRLPDERQAPAGEPVAKERAREEIEAALAQARGSITQAARRLGLKNRYALYRLMKRHGVAAAR